VTCSLDHEVFILTFHISMSVYFLGLQTFGKYLMFCRVPSRIAGLKADTNVLIFCQRRVKSRIISGGNQIVYNRPQKK
jgi:hypothetical protein